MEHIARAHVRTAFHISETTGSEHFVLKFGVLLDAPQLRALHRFQNIYTSARSEVHPFKHTYSLPFVHRAIGVLLV